MIFQTTLKCGIAVSRVTVTIRVTGTAPIDSRNWRDIRSGMTLSATAEDLSFYQAVIQNNPLSIEAHRALMLADLDSSSEAYARLSSIELEMIPYGQALLVVPSHFKLMEQRQNYPYWDAPLSHIAKALHSKTPDLRALDIGANIGQSAGMINVYQPVPCLSVEVGAFSFAMLKHNLNLLGNDHCAIRAFIGDPQQSIVMQAKGFGLEVPAGTAGAIPSISLDDLLAEHPKFQSARLLKIDVEGADFKVLKFAQSFIQAHRPAIFIEFNPDYSPDFNAWCQEGLEAVERLIGHGYQTIMVFDSTGHLMISLQDNLLASISNLYDYQYQKSIKYERVSGHYDFLILPRDLADLEPIIRAGCLKGLDW